VLSLLRFVGGWGSPSSSSDNTGRGACFAPLNGEAIFDIVDPMIKASMTLRTFRRRNGLSRMWWRGKTARGVGVEEKEKEIAPAPAPNLSGADIAHI